MGAICRSTKESQEELKKNNLRVMIDQKSIKESSIIIKYCLDGILPDIYDFETNYYYTSLETLSINFNFIEEKDSKRTIKLTQRMSYKKIKINMLKLYINLPINLKKSILDSQYHLIPIDRYEYISNQLNIIFFNLISEFNKYKYEAYLPFLIIINSPLIQFKSIFFTSPLESLSNDFILKTYLFTQSILKDYQLIISEESVSKQNIKAYFKRIKYGISDNKSNYHYGLVFPIIEISFLNLNNVEYLQNLDYLHKKFINLKKRHKKVILALKAKLKISDDISLVYKLLEEIDGLEDLTLIIIIESEYIVNNLLTTKTFELNFKDFVFFNSDKCSNYNLIIAYKQNIIKQSFSYKKNFYLNLLIDLIYNKNSKCKIFKKINNKDIVKTLSKFIIFKKKSLI